MDQTNPLGAAQSLENRADALMDRIVADEQPKAAPAPAVAAAPEQAVTPEPEKAAPSADEGPEYVNFDDYLSKAGLEREAFLKLPVRIKDADIPLEQVFKHVESAKDVDAQTQALTERQKAWEAQEAQKTQEWTAKLGQAESLSKLAYQELLRDYQQINWNELSQTDPARWNILNTQFTQRYSAIQQQLSQIQASQAEQQQAQVAKQQENLKGEFEKLYQAVPEWRDEGKFKAATETMREYGKTRGFSEAELAAIYDHRYMQVLHDAAQWRAHQQSAQVALKKVRAAPQISAAGARTVSDPKVTQMSQAKAAFQKSPRDLDRQIAYAEQIARHLA